MQRTPDASCILDVTHLYASRHWNNHCLNLSAHPRWVHPNEVMAKHVFHQQMENKIWQRHYFEEVITAFKIPGLSQLSQDWKEPTAPSWPWRDTGKFLTRYHVPCIEMVTIVTLENIWQAFQGPVLRKFHWHRCRPILLTWQYCHWDSQLEIKRLAEYWPKSDVNQGS